MKTTKYCFRAYDKVKKRYLYLREYNNALLLFAAELAKKCCIKFSDQDKIKIKGRKPNIERYYENISISFYTGYRDINNKKIYTDDYLINPFTRSIYTISLIPIIEEAVSNLVITVYDNNLVRKGSMFYADTSKLKILPDSKVKRSKKHGTKRV